MQPKKEPALDMEKLRERYETLNRKKITAEANLTTSSQNLESLQKQAREQYGTDDLALLRAKLEEMTKENERKRAEYQEHLTTIESNLAEVELQQAEASKKESQA
jgi:hypothetical protein